MLTNTAFKDKRLPIIQLPLKMKGNDTMTEEAKPSIFDECLAANNSINSHRISINFAPMDSSSQNEHFGPHTNPVMLCNGDDENNILELNSILDGVETADEDICSESCENILTLENSIHESASNVKETISGSDPQEVNQVEHVVRNWAEKYFYSL